MNALDALGEELRKPVEAGGDARAIWMHARLDALLERERSATCVQRALAFVQLLAADGAVAALALPLGWSAALIGAMVVHMAGTAWMTRSV